MNWILLVAVMYNGSYTLVNIPNLSLHACKLIGHSMLVNKPTNIKGKAIGLPTCVNANTGQMYGGNGWVLNNDTRIWEPLKSEIEKEQLK